MSKSVFISSTSQDLTDYREAVDKVIRRLRLRPINMRDFGSQPGGASGVSLGEVGNADIFVGIIARRYGYIPEGQALSVTEQEYDEAVRRKIPRLMYLLDPDYNWPPERVEATAKDKLDAFRTKIERTDVRSLFTTPDTLAAQVTADLTNLIQKQQRNVLITRLFVLIAAVFALIALVLIADSGVRTPLLVSLGVLTQTYTPSPTATVTTTFTPTLTPTATRTPTPTITPSPTPEFAAARQGEILVIVAEFDRQGAQTATSKTMYEQLQASIQNAANNTLLKDLPIRMGRTAEVITSRDAAKDLAESNNATIVIWGSASNSILTTHYEITPRWGNDVYTPVEQTDFKAQLSASASLLDQVTYRFENAIDQTYVARFTLAQLLYSSKQYQAALPLFEEVLAQVQSENTAEQKARGAAEAWFYVGYIRQRTQHEASKAEEAYNQAISLNPQYTEAYNNRGNALYDQGKLDAAIADYTQAIKLDPQLAVPYNNRGGTLEYQGKLDAAITDYNTAISLNPQYADAYYNRGNALYHQGKLDAAITDYNTAISLNPQYADTYYNRGLALYDQGKLDAAIADFTQTITLNPQYARAYNNRGNALSDQRQLDAAVANYTQAITLDPQYSDAYYNRATALYAQGKLDAAIADYTEVITLNPQDAEAYYNRGVALKAQGKLDAAIADYTQSITLNPQDARAYWGLGNAYYDQKLYAEALQSYQHYLQLAGDNPVAFIVQRVKELELMLKTPTPSNNPGS